MEKTQYFTEGNIQEKSNFWFNELDDKSMIKTDRLFIENSALLILDMQRFFFDSDSHACMPSAQAIINPVLKLTKLFEQENRPIILTKHINTKDNAKMMDYWWSDILTDQNAYCDLIPEMNSIDDAIIIKKSQYDAFYNTHLNQTLTQLNIEQLVIVGVITHLCCETTARSAFVHGYNVFFPIDGTATYNADIHKSSLTNLGHGFANITTTKFLYDQIIR